MDARRTRSCLFLDRDGVINADYGYVHRIEHFHFLPGIFELAHTAVQVLGWHVIVVTNQSGIGCGYFDEAAYEALTCWMKSRFAAEGAPLTDVLHCPYHPVAGQGAYRADHAWRKPNPGMILEATKRHLIDLGSSALAGDRDSDLLAGLSAKVALLIKIGGPVSDERLLAAPHFHAADLIQARQILFAWNSARHQNEGGRESKITQS
jgi:D-glycero-D-manno-heptose 1,7-bisphosphate phosphatase